MKHPPTLADHIAARQRDIADCRALRGAATLRQLAGDANAQHEIASLEDEIAEHARALARLEDALLAQAEQRTDESLDERRRTVKTAMKDVTRLDAEIERVTAEITERLESVAPLVAQVNVALEERERALFVGLRTGLRTSMRPEGLMPLRIDGPVNAAIHSALAVTGLGRNRLRLHNAHIPEGPTFSLGEMQASAEKVRNRVTEALDNALAAIDADKEAA